MLVSTHYMDEAERCHRITYISYGQMLATGTVEEVVRKSGLHTFVVRGNPTRRADERAARPRARSSQVAPFGATLHVVGVDVAKMAEELGGYAGAHGLSIEPGRTSLEDVFIHFMGARTANVGAITPPARAA